MDEINALKEEFVQEQTASSSQGNISQEAKTTAATDSGTPATKETTPVATEAKTEGTNQKVTQDKEPATQKQPTKSKVKINPSFKS